MMSDDNNDDNNNKGYNLETVTNFKYLEAIVTEVRSVSKNSASNIGAD